MNGESARESAFPICGVGYCGGGEAVSSAWRCSWAMLRGRFTKCGLAVSVDRSTRAGLRCACRENRAVQECLCVVRLVSAVRVPAVMGGQWATDRDDGRCLAVLGRTGW